VSSRTFGLGLGLDGDDAEFGARDKDSLEEDAMAGHFPGEVAWRPFGDIAYGKTVRGLRQHFDGDEDVFVIGAQRAPRVEGVVVCLAGVFKFPHGLFSRQAGV